MNCSIRGNPREDDILPKLDEPNVVIGPLNCVLLKMLMNSKRTMISLLPPTGSVFWNATSICVLNGVRCSGFVRGAFPTVKGGPADQAPALNQLLRHEQAGS